MGAVKQDIEQSFERSIAKKMKAKTDNPLYDKKLQKMLDKLISEEMIASMFYAACIQAV